MYENGKINDEILVRDYVRGLCIKKIALRRVIKNAKSSGGVIATR